MKLTEKTHPILKRLIQKRQWIFMWGCRLSIYSFVTPEQMLELLKYKRHTLPKNKSVTTPQILVLQRLNRERPTLYTCEEYDERMKFLKKRQSEGIPPFNPIPDKDISRISEYKSMYREKIQYKLTFWQRLRNFFINC